MSWLAVAAVSAAVSGVIVALSGLLAGGGPLPWTSRRRPEEAEPDVPDFVQPRPERPALKVISSDPDAATVHVLRPRRRPARTDAPPPRGAA